MSLLFYDSGVGGLAYLGELQQHLGQDYPLLYCADSAFFPFGSKPLDQLTSHIEQTVVELVERWRPALVVLACNTASVLALGQIRARVRVPVVGTVPAIKPAAASSQRRRIALLATERTVAADYIDQLIAQYAGDCQVLRLAASGLVDFVELQLASAEPGDLQPLLLEVAAQVQRAQVDRLVLGCTHFLHVADSLRKLLPPSIELVDSLQGVCARVLGLLADAGELAPPACWSGQLLQASIEGQEQRWRYWADRYHLQLQAWDL